MIDRTPMQPLVRRTDYEATFWERVWLAIDTAPMWAVEAVVAIKPIFWGFRFILDGLMPIVLGWANAWLGISWTWHTVYEVSPSWVVFEHYIPAFPLGVALFVTGLVQFYAAFSPEGSYRNGLHRAFAMWHLFVWATAGALFTFAQPPSMLWVDSLAAVIAQFWVTVRIGRVTRTRGTDAIKAVAS